jgi:crotonobetainyl-CoA:carnitine CoA-transferase CaiB-like acyl-CoA transferase
MPSALDGIKVLDFTRYQNGPHATLMLSDMGAEIIKVEMPGDGDPGRSLGMGKDGFCSYFEALNRGKRSITVNLYNPGAREVILELVKRVDVLTENFRPGFLDKLGYSYDELIAVNPRLIYASNSGFGPLGEWRERGSFDVVSQGMSGAMVSQGGGPGNVPMNGPWGLADQVGAMTFAYAIVCALMARERTGAGQRVDVSQLGAMVMLQALSVQAALHTGRQPTGQPGRPTSATFAWYQAGDGGWFTIGILDPKMWPRLCRVLNRADLLTDERSADPFARQVNRDWLMADIQATIATRPRKEWLDLLVGENIPTGPIYDYQEIAEDEQFWVNGYLAKVEHPHFPDHRTIGIPIAMSETPGRIQGVAPELGQDTESILLDLGYSWEKIEALHTSGVTART